ncbi:MAG: 4Fe-4S binding protein [Nitrospirae bacterium]|nr:MAG: 4Fe-4S binding protein [Nitrospirota bacterium]
MMRTDRVRPFRRLAEAVQAVLLIGLPFLKINGESALRFDVPSLQLHFFGATLWMQESFILLVGLLFLVFLILLVTLLFGRIWCGWVCPQTVLADYTGFMDRLGRPGVASRAAFYLLTFGLSLFVAATLVWYFVPPSEFFGQVMSLHPAEAVSWAWGLLTIVIFADLAFVRRRFCATVCPYSRIQSTLFDSSTMAIQFDPGRKEECMNCSACVRVCPTGIDIRKGLDPACISCAACLDVCRDMKEKAGRPGLIGYFFGRPGEEHPLIRRSVLLVASVTLLFLLFFVYLSVNRSPVDMTVTLTAGLPPRITPDGRVVNAFTVTLENRSRRELEVRLLLTGGAIPFRLNPERMVLGPGEHKKRTIFADAKTAAGTAAIPVDLQASFGTAAGGRISKKTTFVVPEMK